MTKCYKRTIEIRAVFEVYNNACLCDPNDGVPAHCPCKESTHTCTWKRIRFWRDFREEWIQRQDEFEYRTERLTSASEFLCFIWIQAFDLLPALPCPFARYETVTHREKLDPVFNDSIRPAVDLTSMTKCNCANSPATAKRETRIQDRTVLPNFTYVDEVNVQI